MEEQQKLDNPRREGAAHLVRAGSTDDGWGMGLPGPIRVRHPSTDRTTPYFFYFLFPAQTDVIVCARQYDGIITARNSFE